MTQNGSVRALTEQMRANSERWFPDTHEQRIMPLAAFYALGLAGEAGEVANVVKKMVRDGSSADLRASLGIELADVLTYLLLLADEVGVDIVEMYRVKAEHNDRRWGGQR
jgi:NTP pyrophosphatase (non-canonical NTP hydrolase)